MYILFNSNMYLYLLAYVIIPVLVLYSIYSARTHLKDNTTNNQYLSKQTTDLLRGICILVVMIHHLTQRMISPQYMKPFLEAGYLGVSIFLFLSGYALMISYLKKENYLKGFVYKRLGRVYMPFLIVNIIYILLNNVLLKMNYGIKDIIYTSVTVQFVDYILWYVKITIFFYVVFYASLKIFNKNNAFRTMLICSVLYIVTCRYILKLDMFWYNTAFCFPIGVGFALYKDYIVAFFEKHYLPILLSVFLGFGSTFLVYYKDLLVGKVIFNIVSSIFFTLFIVILVYKVDIQSKVLIFIGKISFEMYLIHLVLLQIYFKTVDIKGSYSVFIFFGLSIVLAYGLKQAFDYGLISKLLTKVKSKKCETEIEFNK